MLDINVVMDISARNADSADYFTRTAKNTFRLWNLMENTSLEFQAEYIFITCYSNQYLNYSSRLFNQITLTCSRSSDPKDNAKLATI